MYYQSIYYFVLLTYNIMKIKNDSQWIWESKKNHCCNVFLFLFSFCFKMVNYRVFMYAIIINMDNKCHFRIFMMALMAIKHRCFYVCYVCGFLSKLYCSSIHFVYCDSFAFSYTLCVPLWNPPPYSMHLLVQLKLLIKWIQFVKMRMCKREKNQNNNTNNKNIEISP